MRCGSIAIAFDRSVKCQGSEQWSIERFTQWASGCFTDFVHVTQVAFIHGFVTCSDNQTTPQSPRKLSWNSACAIVACPVSIVLLDSLAGQRMSPNRVIGRHLQLSAMHETRCVQEFSLRP